MTYLKGSSEWTSPSNIALVKYWGKHHLQLPSNPSISFTLKNCNTRTKLDYKPGSGNIEVYVDGSFNESFQPKIEIFFQRIKSYCPCVTELDFTIHTTNTFPHSCGIASSASGFSALALCVLEIEYGKNRSKEFFEKASFIARLGSGSACRSLFKGVTVWGKHELINSSSNDYAVEIEEIDEVFKSFQDTILLVDKGQKTVSSTIGHCLMDKHPFAQARFDQAVNNCSKLLHILKNGHLTAFAELVENEALTLHGMMMTSTPSYILIGPNTLQIIKKIRAHRKKHHSHICFTLDAGANVHMLYPEYEKKMAMELIEKELISYCQNGTYICDKVGLGPFCLT